MIALERGGEFAVGFDSACERFFQHHAVAGLNHEAGVSVMVLSGRDDDGCIANLGASEIFDGRKDWDLGADFVSYAMGAFGIEIRKRGELAGLCFPGEFLRVQSMDGAHAAESRHGDFQAFGQGSVYPTNFAYSRLYICPHSRLYIRKLGNPSAGLSVLE